jgi:hypothetical protein
LRALIIKVEVNPLGKAGQRRASEMKVVEASAVIPLNPEETYDALIGDQIQRLVEMPSVKVVAVEDYQMRPDDRRRTGGGSLRAGGGGLYLI